LLIKVKNTNGNTFSPPKPLYARVYHNDMKSSLLGVGHSARVVNNDGITKDILAARLILLRHIPRMLIKANVIYQ
jgi:hypothetical protein